MGYKYTKGRDIENLNDTLPENINRLIQTLSTQQAVPLGKVNEIPFLAIKLGVEDEKYIKEGGLSSELKASILNIDYEEDTFALCYVQVRLNGDNKFIYTVVYDLSNDKHYNDCFELLKMENYGLFIASDNIHDFVSFEAKFEANFKPRDILAYAKKKATSYIAEKFAEVSYGLSSQTNSKQELWDYLNYLAPYDKSWYGAMKISKD